jgi:hypothetical protein
LCGLFAIACSLVPVSARAATIYGLLSTGELYASDDHGATWAGRTAIPVRDAVALRARSSTLELFLAAQSGFVARSSDAGASWEIRSAVPATDVADLLILPGGDLVLLTASGSTYRSSDLGASFSAVSIVGGSNFVALARASTGEVCALSRTGELYASGDEGLSWGARSTVSVPDAAGLASSPLGLCLLTETGEVLRSMDAGWTWSAAGTLSQVGSRGIVADGEILAAATREGHVAISPDGATWTWIGSINQLALTALAVDTPAISAIADPADAIRVEFAAPVPNPAGSWGSLFAFRLVAEDLVALELSDPAGRILARKGPERFAAGPHEIRWAPRVPGAGVYFVRLGTSRHGARVQKWLIPPGNR